jgi:hypothetical protein
MARRHESAFEGSPTTQTERRCPKPVERLGVAIRGQRIYQILRLHEVNRCSRGIVRRRAGSDIDIVDDQQFAFAPRPK